MEQYEKSGTGAKVNQESSAPDLDARLRRLEEDHRQQQEIIVELQTEIRRLKAKLDRHADYLNKQQRG